MLRSKPTCGSSCCRCFTFLEKLGQKAGLYQSVQPQAAALLAGTTRAPMVFTEDEYRLWQMESREDAENGADDRRVRESERGSRERPARR